MKRSIEVTCEGDLPSIERAFAELEAECARIISGMAVWMFKSILERTPQYHGRLAASWTFSQGSPEYVDRSDMVTMPQPVSYDETLGEEFDPADIRRKGHPEAISVALAESRGADLDFKLGETIWIANGADHGEGPYAADVESGKVPLRRVNRPGNAVARTLDIITVRFSEDMTPRAGSTFKNTFIGY